MKKVINQQPSPFFLITAQGLPGLQSHLAGWQVKTHGILAYGFIGPLSHHIELLQQPITMLVLISHHHLIKGCLHCVTQHSIHSKPHSRKTIQKTLVYLTLQDAHGVPRVYVPSDISQPKPLVIHAGIIIQLRQCNFSIYASGKSSLGFPLHS